jgi:hypothetical protein
MKKVFLLMVVPALLVAMGFAQTPAASGTTDQVNIQGCLGGTDGNYTVAEDNTGKTFKITSSSADLKAFSGQEVKLSGQKGAAENSLAVTAVNMISEHCATSAAAPAAAISAPPEAGTPPAAAAAPAAAPAAIVSTTPETASTTPAAAAPAATVSTTPETVSTPAAAAPAAAPAAIVSAPAETVSTTPATAAPAAAPAPLVSSPVKSVSAPTKDAVAHRTGPAAHPRKAEAKAAAEPAATPAPAKPASTPVADAAVPTAPADPQEADSTPVKPAPKPSWRGSTLMLVGIVVVLLLLGIAVPFYSRSRKQKLLDQAGGENLSFTHRASSDPGLSDKTGGQKAA